MTDSNTIVPRTGQAGALLPPASGGAAAFGMASWPSSEGAPAFANVANQLGVGQSATGLVYEGSTLFALEDIAGPSCRLVYTGPACTALVRVTLSVAVVFESGNNTVAVSLDGDLDDGDPNVAIPLGAQQAIANADDAFVLVLVTERRVALASGTKFGPVLGTQAGGDALIAAAFTMSVQVVG